MTLNELLTLIEDRLDGHGLTITDFDRLRERIENQADLFDWHDCHEGNGACGHIG